MPLRIICRRPIDPQTMEFACGTAGQYCICPECDEPIVLAVADATAEAASGAVSVKTLSSAFVVEGDT